MIFKIRAAWKVENIRRVRTIACVRLREQDLNNDFGREFTSRNASGNIVKFWVSPVRWDPRVANDKGYHYVAYSKF